MRKNLFQLIAGGQVQPKIMFTCNGMNSELVIVANIRTMPHRALSDLLAVPGVLVTHCQWLTWQIKATGSTQRLSRIHYQLLRRSHSGGLTHG